MKVLFLVQAGEESIGAAKRALCLAPYLAKRGDEVTIVINKTEKNVQRVGNLVGVKGVYIEADGLSARSEIKNKINQENPDVVYTNGIKYDNIVYLRNVKRVIEWAELFSKSDSRSIASKVKYAFYEWISLLISNGIIVANKNMKKIMDERIEKLGLSKSIKYLPYGVHSDGEKKEVVRDRNNIKRLIYVGSLERLSALKSMIDAFKRVVETQKCELVIVGSGSQQSRLRRYTDKQGVGKYIHFKGYLSDEELDKCMSTSDVFLCPMEVNKEDMYRFPSKIPMYMQYNKPIVTCKTGETERCLEDKGFFYEGGNEELMAESILDALENGYIEYEKINEYSWKNITKKFRDWVGKI